MSPAVQPDDALGLEAARILLDTGAVLFRPEQPFFFSSGWASPVFVDCKRVVSYPLARDALMALAIKRILSVTGYEALDGIAGAEAGGVAFAAIIADRLHLPLVVSRKQPAGLGPGAQTDGQIRPGARILLVDDVTTDGRTKANMASGLRRSGADVRHAFVIFKYGIFDAVVREAALGVELCSLLSWRELLQAARDARALPADVLRGIEGYIDDPLRWSSAHGGRGADTIG